MPDPAERQRTVLRAPRVEFDLSALALGAGGYLAFQFVWPLLASLLAVPDNPIHRSWDALRNEFFARALSASRLPYTEHIGGLVGARWPMVLPPAAEGQQATQYELKLETWKLWVVGAALLLLWSLVAGAISRVYAVRIARDESIGAGEGLAFSLGNLRGFLLAPAFVAAAAALSFGLAALGGALAAVPTAGPVLQIVAQPLALFGGLLVILFAIGGIFGLPVMHAALATEKNGCLDAVSRTFSYVFTRPLAYIVSATLVIAVASVVARFGAAFIGVATQAMMFGASWNADPNAPADAARGILAGAESAYRSGSLFSIPQAEKVEGIENLWIWVSWAFTSLALVLVNGFALSYFVGGLTDTYFLLRREVDGIDDGEVYVEGAEASLGEPSPMDPAKGGGKS